MKVSMQFLGPDINPEPLKNYPIVRQTEISAEVNGPAGLYQ